MTAIRHTDDENTTYKDISPLRSNANGMARTIIIALVVFSITSWIGYITLRTINVSVEVASVTTKVAVIEAINLTIKDDIIDMKSTLKEIRNDQVRRQKQGK